MIDTHEILWGIVAPPLLMAAGMMLTAAVPVSRRFLSTGALLAVVFAIGHLGMRGWPIPGGDVHNWPPWIALAGGLMTLCSACGHGPVVWRVLVRLAITSLAIWLLRPQLGGASMGVTVAWITGGGLLWTALILAWERVHAATTPGVSATTLTVLAGVSALTLLLFNTMTHAQFAGILTAALTAAAVLLWWRPNWYHADGPVTVTALVLPALWLLGNRYVSSGLPDWALPLLAFAGLAPLLIDLQPMRTWSSGKRLMLAILVVLVLVAPVVVWGVITSLRAAGQPSYGY